MKEYKEVPMIKLIGGKRFKLYNVHLIKGQATKFANSLRQTFKDIYIKPVPVRVVPFKTTGTRKLPGKTIYCVYVRSI